MDKETKDIVKKIKRDVKSKKLSKEEKKEYYDDVYHLYGANIYRKATPRSIRESDIDDLLDNGKFDDIYFKHGEKVYKEELDYMKSKDIEYETGKKHLVVLHKIRTFIRNQIISPLLSSIMLFPASTVAITEFDKKVEDVVYKEQIEEYIENIEKYADSINEENLPQIQVLMSVTDDMWNGIKGYGDPKLDLFTCRGLDLANEDGVGVCRNMADDAARKLNLIDENYNARVVNVYVDGTGYKFADIEIKIVKEEKEEENKEETEDKIDVFDKIDEFIVDNLVPYTGNHAVVILDSIEEKATLILDPTNPGIGVIKDGKVIMFNSTGMSFTVTPILNFLVSDDRIGLATTLLKTYDKTDLSIEQLEEKYGLEAQNNALKQLRDKEKTFKDSIKVETENAGTIEINFSDNFQYKDNTKEDNDMLR